MKERLFIPWCWRIGDSSQWAPCGQEPQAEGWIRPGIQWSGLWLVYEAVAKGCVLDPGLWGTPHIRLMAKEHLPSLLGSPPPPLLWGQSSVLGNHSHALPLALPLP